MPSLPVFVDICKALRISQDYLLQDVLTENEVGDIHVYLREVSEKESLRCGKT